MTERPRARLDRYDWLLITSLILLIGFYAVGYFDFSSYPSEDAAILMRYSQHVAQGFGVVWNIGDGPVDGATDFLFMVLLAGLVRIGMTLEAAVRAVGLVSHVLTVVVVYAAIRKYHRAHRWAAWVSGAYLALGPAMAYIAAYFGTPFFALAASVTWYVALKLVDEKGREARAAPFIFALSGLAMGLVRPEGVLMAIFMLLSVLYMRGLKESRAVLLCFVLVFALIGGLYFAWRWNYFGFPLPNPFYKKGGGNLHPNALLDAIKNTSFLTLPFLLVFGLGFRSLAAARRSVFALIPVAGFTGIWVLMSNEMNYFMRFQYPVLPVVLMSWPGLMRGAFRDDGIQRTNGPGLRGWVALVLPVAAVSLAILAFQLPASRAFSKQQHLDGRYDVAVVLSEYAEKDYVIATSEAGLLPLYSRWRAVDTWGLNDPWIAHNGRITEEYLGLYRPHVILYFSPFTPVALARGDDSFSSMVLTLRTYAERNGYVLAGAFGETIYDTHYYYVRPDFPDSAAIIEKIQSMDYFWFATGRKSLNYARVQLPGR